MNEMRKSSFSLLSPALVHFLIAGGKHAWPEEEHQRNVHETFSQWRMRRLRLVGVLSLTGRRR